MSFSTQPEGSRPAFAYSYSRAALWSMVIALFIGISVLTEVLPFFTQDGLVILLAWAICIAIAIVQYRLQFATRPKSVRFYENYLEVAGRNFRRLHPYNDVSKLWLSRTMTFGARSNSPSERVKFALRDEPAVFVCKNLKSKPLKSDLYSWMSRKVPAESLQKPANPQPAASP